MKKVNKDIDIFILCGGFGKRLKSLTTAVPKPMLRVGGAPFLNVIISYFVSFGFRRFILGVGYKAGAIKKYYRNNPVKGLKILFSSERVPLDTGGALKNAKELIKSDSFIVLNGDSFSEFNPSGLLDFHRKKKALISILLRRSRDGKDYGEIKIDKNYRIKSFNEKNNRAGKCLINAGVYVFDKKLFSLMPQIARFSLERDLFPKMLNLGIFGYKKSGFFIDIGTPERYKQADKYFTKARRCYGRN